MPDACIYLLETKSRTFYSLLEGGLRVFLSRKTPEVRDRRRHLGRA